MQRTSPRIRPTALIAFGLAILTLVVCVATEEHLLTPGEFIGVMALLFVALLAA